MPLSHLSIPDFKGFKTLDCSLSVLSQGGAPFLSSGFWSTGLGVDSPVSLRALCGEFSKGTKVLKTKAFNPSLKSRITIVSPGLQDTSFTLSLLCENSFGSS
jgi:hypothetical protein